MSKGTELTKENLHKFFSSLIIRYRVMKEIKKQTDRYLASDFNVFEIFGPDENKISDILAIFLDPAGHHGQKDKFLRLFLKHLCLIGCDIFQFESVHLPTYTECETEESKVRYFDVPEISGGRFEIIREKATDEYRRMDVFLKIGCLCIGIENKPWALEQKNQLKDYAKYLKEKCGERNFILIYLDGVGRKAVSVDEKTKSQLGRRFCETSYAKLLIPWLSDCIRETEADKVRWFLRDFKEWIEENFHDKERNNE